MEFFAVIPTYNRPKELMALVNQLLYQGVRSDHILVIDNSDQDVIAVPYATYKFDSDRSPHIYAMWNAGLEWANDKNSALIPVSDPWWPTNDHCVAVLNDDIIIPNNFVDRMTEVMRAFQPTIAFPNQHGHRVALFNKQPGGIDLSHRMAGYCFVVNGRSGIRLDEDFKWWYGDDDLDWRARSDYAGTYLVQDVTIQHLYPNQSTNSDSSRGIQARIDRETFVKKHGEAPW